MIFRPQKTRSDFGGANYPCGILHLFAAGHDCECVNAKQSIT